MGNFQAVEFKEDLLKYFKCVFQFGRITQIEGIYDAHQQVTCLYNSSALKYFTSFHYDGYGGGGVISVTMDDTNFQDLLCLVLFNSFSGDILWNTCEFLLRCIVVSQFTLKVRSHWHLCDAMGFNPKSMDRRDLARGDCWQERRDVVDVAGVT